jgi:hypothetical protein
LEDIKFTNPYRKRKSDEYLNTSISQFHDSLQKKQRIVDMEVCEIELGQQQQQRVPIGVERVTFLLEVLEI